MDTLHLWFASRTTCHGNGAIIFCMTPGMLSTCILVLYHPTHCCLCLHYRNLCSSGLGHCQHGFGCLLSDNNTIRQQPWHNNYGGTWEEAASTRISHGSLWNLSLGLYPRSSNQWITQSRMHSCFSYGLYLAVVGNETNMSLLSSILHRSGGSMTLVMQHLGQWTNCW